MAVSEESTPLIWLSLDVISWYPKLFQSLTVIIGASEIPGFVISAFVPNTIDDCGCLKFDKSFINSIKTTGTRDLAPKAKVIRCRHRHALRERGWHVSGGGGWHQWQIQDFGQGGTSGVLTPGGP